jgi:thiol:disulfide interchange protein DsbD
MTGYLDMYLTGNSYFCKEIAESDMMIKRYILIITLSLLSVTLFSQIYSPVTWRFGYEKVGDGQYEVIFTAVIEKHSHIYAMDIPEGGPIPTSILTDTLPGYMPDGKAYEVTNPVEVFDEAFGFRIKTFSDTAEFRQKLSSREAAFSVKGTITYMACNNATCLPPKDVEFEIMIGNDEKGKSAGTKDFTPVPSGSEGVESPSGRGLLGFFLISILAGMAGILTPCVFPMIPMTVAFFSQGSDKRTKAFIKAMIFGISIVLIYASLGIIVSLSSAGAGFANALSTHWIPNSLFFLLFLLFAVSFFGAFEIILPNKWVSSADSRVDKGGMLASFFMGMTTVIVSFSCTGPIVGALLVEAATGDVLKPTMGMLGFGLGFGTPFTLFALFPSVIKKMPKSGGWLNSVKVVLGFIMLAFSLKFLSTIDSVYSLKILPREIFLAIWIVIFFLLGLYLMGKIKFAHDGDLPFIGTFRLFLVILVFSFVVWLITGLFGAPLRSLSALLPAQKSSAFNIQQQVVTDSRVSGVPEFRDILSSDLCSTPKYGDIFDLPYGLKGYFDLKQGLDCAREQDKPVLLDFKGHACANCKLMEAKVWSDPEVLRRLSENFVIVALYVDDRTQLPEDEWVTSTIDGKVKKTIGKINEDIEISLFGTNAMPLYVIAGHNDKPLIKPMATNLKVGEYIKWLDDGVKAFKESR